MRAEFPSSGEINFRVADKGAAVAAVRGIFEPDAASVDRTDGLSCDFGDWRFQPARLQHREPAAAQRGGRRQQGTRRGPHRRPVNNPKQVGRAVAVTIRKAIFPVAGLGTRFLPATKSIPKEILTLVDRPLIDYAVEEAREAGIEDFIFVTSRGKSALSDYFDDAPELEARLEAAGKWDALEAVRRATCPAGKLPTCARISRWASATPWPAPRT